MSSPTADTANDARLAAALASRGDVALRDRSAGAVPKPYVPEQERVAPPKVSVSIMMRRNAVDRRPRVGEVVSISYFDDGVWDTEITHVTVKGVSVKKAEWEPGDNFVEKDIRWNEWMGRLVEFVDVLPVAQASSKAEPKLSVSPKKAAAKKEAPAPPLPAVRSAAAPPPAPPLPAPPAQPAPLASPASPVSIAPFSYDGECAGCMYSFEHKRAAHVVKERNVGGAVATHSCSRARCKKEGCNQSRGGPALEMMEGFGYCAVHKKEREIVSAVLPVAPAPQASLSPQKKKAIAAALSSLATRNIDAVIDTASDDDSEAAASLTWEEYLCGPGGTPTTPSRWEEIGDEWDVVLGGEGGGDVADERRDDQPEVPDLDSDAGRDRAWSHDS